MTASPISCTELKGHELQELTAAAKLVEPLCSPTSGVTVPSLRSAVGRMYLQSGYISLAARHFAAVAEDPSADMSMKAMNEALQASAEGDWNTAADALRTALASNPENYVVRVDPLKDIPSDSFVERLSMILRSSFCAREGCRRFVIICNHSQFSRLIPFVGDTNLGRRPQTVAVEHSNGRALLV